MFVLGSNLSQAAPFPTTKSFQLILACPPYDDLNLPAPNPSNLTTTLSYHTVFSYSQSTNADLFARLFTCPSIQTNSSSHPQPTKHLLKCTFSKSLTHKQANLKEPYNQDIKAQISKQLLTSRINPSKILQTGQGFIFKCVLNHGLEKIFRFTVSRFVHL